MPTLLIIWHSRTGTAEQMTNAIAAGAAGEADVVTIAIRAEATHSDTLLDADAYIFVCPENLGSMSGAMKEMVDRSYYDLLDRVNGRPCALAIAAGTDGSGAVRQWERILTGWRLRLVTEPLIIRTGADSPRSIRVPKQISAADHAAARDIGQLMASGLAMGVF